MPNFGDQARLPTDRPPDSQGADGFPKTKTILWDKSGIGKPTYLHLGYFRKPRVCIPEKVLKLVQHQCENYGQKNHTLIGTLIVEDDGEAVQFQVDRLDTRPIMSADVSANLAPGDLLIPLEVTNNTAGKRRGCVDDFVTAITRLQERCCSKTSIELSNFVLLRGWVSFYSNAHSSVAHMDFDMVTMGTVFKASPIAAVPIVLTALSKNLAGPMSLSHTQGTPKSGYLTMDHTRKLLLVLESDPKAGTLPIVGVWVSGVEFVHHSFVWAACLRYIHNTHLQDRVCAPPEEFLLVLYSPLHSRPEFYQCGTTTGESKLLYQLYCGHEVCNHTKSLSSQSNDFTEVELSGEQNGEEKALFDAALAKHSAVLSDGHPEKRWTDDINPRSIPTPHTQMLPVIKPMVPDVSILWTDSPNNSALPPPPPTPPSSQHPPSMASQQHAPIGYPMTYNRPPPPAMPFQQASTNSTHAMPSSGIMAQSQPLRPQAQMCAVRPPRDNIYPQYSSASSGVPFSQPYVSPVHHNQQFHPPSVQNPSSSALTVSNNSVMNMNNNQSSSPNLNPHSASRNVIPVSQNFTDHHTSPQTSHTQNPGIFYTPTNQSHRPQNSYNSNQQSHSHHQELQSAPNTVYTPHCNVGNKPPQNHMVLSTQGQNTHLTTLHTGANHNQQHLVLGPNQSPNQIFPATPSPQVPSGHTVVSDNHNNSATTPQSWQNNQIFARNSSVTAGEQQSQRHHQTGQSYNNNLLNSNNNTPLSRNHFTSVNALKTVVEETLSSSSSLSSSSNTACGGCKCQSEKTISASNVSSASKQMGADASITGSHHHSVAGNTTRSSDDDSGLSVTPERPSSSPPPASSSSLPPPQPSASSSASGGIAMSQDKCPSAFGEAMNNVNWDQVPPEIRCLLIQQNEQLKLLQQQIQLLMLNQSSQNAASSSPGNGVTSSGLPHSAPPTSSSSSETRRLCSVAVNTSLTDDTIGSQPTENCLPRPSSSSSLSNTSQSHGNIEGEISHNSSIPVHSTSGNSALGETNNSSQSNRVSSSKSSSPQIRSVFDRGVVEDSYSSSSFEHSKDSRTSMNAAGVSEVDFNRSQIDPSYPNESDFYNNYQDESYSTVAEDATDPRHFYDQIMNNINMFLTNGEDNNSAPTEQEEETSTLQDSSIKYPESANSTMFPHINYMSMMMGAGSDTGQSMEINAMAMKYLKDDQLTQMAMMLKQGGGEDDERSTNKLLQRMIRAGGSNSSGNKMSSFDVSHMGISPNNLTMGTRNYLEKHGLLGNDSTCFNDYSMLDHTLKLKTDFSVAMTDRDNEKSLANLASPMPSPVKNYGRTQVASSSPLAEARIDPKDDNRQNFCYKRNDYPKDLGASPVLLLPQKHYNTTQSPAQRVVDRNPRRSRDEMSDRDDSVDSDNILDIAKLKRLPKLL